MEDNVEVIHFHIKRRGVQGLVFLQITFEKCTANLYFENAQDSTEMAVVNVPTWKQDC